MIDVGFGGTGPIRLLLLADGSNGDKQFVVEDDGEGQSVPRAGWVWGTYPPERHRLVRGALPESSLGGSSRAAALLHTQAPWLTCTHQARPSRLKRCANTRMAPPGFARICPPWSTQHRRATGVDDALLFQ